MDARKILEELYAERRVIDQAIAALEMMAADRGKRRGRPPKWLQEVREKLKAGEAGSKKG